MIPMALAPAMTTHIILRLRKEPVLRLPGQDPPGTVAAAVPDLQLSPGNLWAYGVGHGRQVGGILPLPHTPEKPPSLFLFHILRRFKGLPVHLLFLVFQDPSAHDALLWRDG